MSTFYWVSVSFWCLLAVAIALIWSDHRHFRFVPWAVIVSALIWGMAVCQSFSYPKLVVEKVAPGSFEVHTTWVPDTVHAELLSSNESATREFAALRERSIPISVSPSDTRIALSRPLFFGFFCWLCFHAARDRNAIALFATVIVVTSSVFATLGLADLVILSRDWQSELRQSLLISPVGADNPFGPFVNNNNAGGYLNLSIGVAVGLIVFIAGRAQVRGHSTPQRRKLSALQWTAVLSCLAAIIVMVAGVIGSGSRGGFLGAGTGALVLVTISMPRVPKFKLAVAAAGVVLLSWSVLSGLGVGESSSARLGTLVEGEALDDPRLPHWRDALDAAVFYMPFGAGLGTYRYAYLPFQEEGGSVWFVNADGMPVEWLVEGGIWLLPMILAAFGLVIFQVLKLHWGSQHTANDPDFDSRVRRSMVGAMAFAMPSLAVTQCFDFAITLPPTLLLFAAMCGCVSRLTLDQTEETGEVEQDGRTTEVVEGRKPFSSRYSGMIAVGVASVLLVGLFLATIDLHAGMLAERERLNLKKEQKDALVDLPRLSDRIARLSRLALKRPGDAQVNRVLSDLRIEEQRRVGAAFLYGIEPTNFRAHEKWVAPATVRRAANEFDRPLEQLIMPTQDADEWRLAREESLRALLACPLDDRARHQLLVLDFVGPTARISSTRLVEQSGLLRSRTAETLKFLESLCEVYPADESLEMLQHLRRQLRSK